MTDKITHISRVIIKKLWGYSDLNFEWKLNPDVNVLAGDNGSGKSTVLKLIAAISVESLIKSLKHLSINRLLAEKIEICSNNNICASYSLIKGSITGHKKQGKEFKSVMWDEDRDTLTTFKDNEVWKLSVPTEFQKGLNASIITTFDQELKEKESIQKLSSDKVKTELDWQIHQLQEQYKDYQINIGKRANEVLKRAITNGAAGLAKAEQEIDKKKNMFSDMIDDLFKSTQKKIDREKNEISFIQREKDIISPYQLSSGEKQILVILLTALIQDNKHSVMIMDEPEISLHTDWQESLIDNIRKLNENAQIIIATHSPFIISKGWASEGYVFQMDKIKLR